MSDLISRSALGAVVMQQAAIAEIDCGGCYGRCNDPANCQMEDVKAIRAIPLPTHADLLAAALALPEVAALVKAGNVLRDVYRNSRDGLALGRAVIAFSATLSALEARHD